MPAVGEKDSVGKRETQEDARRVVLQSEEDPNGDVLMLLADGMGGHVGGEVASNLALDTFAAHFVNGSHAPRPRGRLNDSLTVANTAIAKRVEEDAALAGMGCTLIAALKIADRLVWASVGDSVLFLLRNGTLRRLNADHSVYGELLQQVAAGHLAQAEADAHPRRNALRSALIGEPIPLVDLDSTALENGDLVVLATDGVETLSDDEIATVLRENEDADPQEIAERLVAEVEHRDRPRQDNCTVIVYRHGQSPGEAKPRDSKWTLPTTVVPAGAQGASRSIAAPMRHAPAHAGSSAEVKAPGLAPLLYGGAAAVAVVVVAGALVLSLTGRDDLEPDLEAAGAPGERPTTIIGGSVPDPPDVSGDSAAGTEINDGGATIGEGDTGPDTEPEGTPGPAETDGGSGDVEAGGAEPEADAPVVPPARPAPEAGDTPGDAPSETEQGGTGEAEAPPAGQPLEGSATPEGE